MTTLTDFLLARIAEDEAAASRAGSHNGVGVYANDNYGCLLVQPARVLAECEAKRRVIDAAWECQEMLDIEHHLRDRSELEAAGDYPATLRHLAQPYADHPDFDPSWAVS